MIRVGTHSASQVDGLFKQDMNDNINVNISFLFESGRRILISFPSTAYPFNIE
jgi:hypothetical protein